MVMKLEQLTFSRFLAAASIVIYHYGLNVFPFNVGPIHSIFRSANYGVGYFYVLSGFVMIIAYGRGGELNPYEFLKQRFARIYPVYFLSLLLALIFNVINDTRGYFAILLSFLAVQAWYPSKALSFNPPAWSISVEFFFYAVFPFLLNSVYLKTRLRKFLVPIVLLFLLTQVISQVLNAQPAYHLDPAKTNFLSCFPLMHLNQFLIGNLAGLYFIRHFRQRANFDGPIAILVFCMILLVSSHTGMFLSNGLLDIVFAPIILLVAANTGWITKVFKHRIFVFLGDISFTIYILQYPVYQWSEIILRRLQLSAGSAFFAFTIILLVLSALCHTFFEMPARKMIKTFSMSRAAQVS
jgi:peptidoglycan/LPS O-acetylase OafA/YrhL